VATELQVDTHSVGLTVRPPSPSGLVIFYVHGDQYLASAPEAAIDLAGHLALRTGAEVVCPRFRPSFPPALEDIRSAFDYCHTAGSVIVAGERVGAGLVAALLVRLRDEGALLPQRAVLVSPLLDLTLETPSLSVNARADPSFDVAELRRRAAVYADGTAPTDPLLSPLFANLHGLPPVQIQAAGTDPLLDDSLAFAARAARSGVTVDLHIRPEAASLRSAIVPTMATFIGARVPSPR
jgi:epsilon-lactone hydrolase